VASKGSTWGLWYVICFIYLVMTKQLTNFFLAVFLFLFSSALLASDEVVIQVVSDEILEMSGTDELDEFFQAEEYGFKVKSVNFTQIEHINSLIGSTDTLVGLVLHGHGSSSSFKAQFTKEQVEQFNLSGIISGGHLSARVSGEQLANFIYGHLPVKQISNDFFIHHFSCSSAGYCKTGDNFQETFLKKLSQLFTADGYTNIGLKSFAFINDVGNFVHKVPDRVKSGEGYLLRYFMSAVREGAQEKSLHNWWTRNLKWSNNKKSMFTYIALGILMYQIEPYLLAFYVPGLVPLHLMAIRNEALVGSHARMISIENNEFKKSPKATIKTLLRESLSTKARSCKSMLLK